MDDFDVILGDEFFVVAKAALLPFIGEMLIFDEKQPCYVPTRYVTGNSKTSKGKEPIVCWAKKNIQMPMKVGN